eukprot:271646-Hanusia_phi.AAC.1
MIKNAIFGENSLKTMCQAPTDPLKAFCNTFNPEDVGYLLTSKYGLRGKIELKDSLTGVLVPIVEVGYCSILPNMSGSPYAAANKAKIIQSGTSCDSSSRRRRRTRF